ncbi:MAG: DNA-directed RNA polymerase, subunit E'' [Candidatus Aenigmarchaeota archaeon]|nr:DNA-directed RNA polymerase, subunit E'' [Candidatus Aenigmarchaeota archaeon]
MTEKACKICKRLIEGDVCPIDKNTDLTKSWNGYIVIIDPQNSEIAKEAGITSPGKFALRVRE